MSDLRIDPPDWWWGESPKKKVIEKDGFDYEIESAEKKEYFFKEKKGQKP